MLWTEKIASEKGEELTKDAFSGVRDSVSGCLTSGWGNRLKQIPCVGIVEW